MISINAVDSHSEMQPVLSSVEGPKNPNGLDSTVRPYVFAQGDRPQ
jgi:hypothetical protein